MATELLTSDEAIAMEMLAKAAVALNRVIFFDGCDLDIAKHDWDEMCHLIHGLQNAVLAQVPARLAPSEYRVMGAKVGT